MNTRHLSLLFLLSLTGLVLTASSVSAADTAAFTHRHLPAVAVHKPIPREPYQLDQRYRLTRSPVARQNDSRPFARQIALAASETGLDPELLHAVIAVESAYQFDAVSAKGAVGLMQVLPETAQMYGIRDASEVSANLRAGSRHLSNLMQRFDRRLDLALAAYNAGEGAVIRHNNNIPPFAETLQYVPAVIARYRENAPRATGGMPAKPATTRYLAGTSLELRPAKPLL